MVASGRFMMYILCEINRGQLVWLLPRGCLLFGGDVLLYCKIFVKHVILFQSG